MTEILTTHAGSLPRTRALIEANAERPLEADGITPAPSAEFDAVLREAVDQVVARQKALGISIPGDGEYGKAMSAPINYGAWWAYIYGRTEGLELTGTSLFTQEPVLSEPGAIRLTSFGHRRDRVRFADAYSNPVDGIDRDAVLDARSLQFPEAVGPISYSERGRELVAADLRNFRGALDVSGYSTGFVSTLSPGSGARVSDAYYGDDDAFLDAWVEVMRPEYQAIASSGLLLQIDDPSVAENWDQITPEPSVEDYLAFTAKRVAAINRALEGIDPAQVRFHLCWGSWHGPHTTDLEFRYLADLMLEVNARYFSFEAGNVRHEHEWTVWQQVTLPEDRVLVPGVISHATNVVEHPELVAQRLGRFADIVGPERVIASSDCGLGGRIHEDIAWAKLESLVEGARLASARF